MNILVKCDEGEKDIKLDLNVLDCKSLKEEVIKNLVDKINKDYNLYYKDEDGDNILIKNDEDLSDYKEKNIEELYISKDPNLKDKLDKIENDLNEAKISLKEKDETILKMKESFESLNTKIKKKEEENNEIIINENITQKEEEINKLKENIKQKEEEISKLTEDVEQKGAKIKQKESEISKLTEDVKQKGSKINELTECIKQKESEISESKKDIRQKELEISELKVNIKEALDKNQDLINTMDVSNVKITDLEKKSKDYDFISQENEIIKKKSEDLVQENKNLNEQIVNFKGENEGIKGENIKLKQQIESLYKSINAHKDEIQNMRKNFSSLFHFAVEGEEFKEMRGTEGDEKVDTFLTLINDGIYKWPDDVTLILKNWKEIKFEKVEVKLKSLNVGEEKKIHLKIFTTDKPAREYKMIYKLIIGGIELDQEIAIKLILNKK